MKWLPVPSVPRCLTRVRADASDVRRRCARSAGRERSQPTVRARPADVAPRAAIVRAAVVGAAVRHGAPRSPERMRVEVVRQVGRGEGRALSAIMPQPMSTPTAAGMIAPFVGITLPTVAPMPRCTSGITATHLWTKGRRATLSSCARAAPRTGRRASTP